MDCSYVLMIQFTTNDGWTMLWAVSLPALALVTWTVRLVLTPVVFAEVFAPLLRPPPEAVAAPIALNS
jgi:hypothetical protein